MSNIGLKIYLSLIILLVIIVHASISLSQDKTKEDNQITFQEGSGDSIRNPVIITGAKNYQDAIAAEYIYLRSRFQTPDVDWKLINQSVIKYQNKYLDLVEIKLSNGSKQVIYFDITNYYHKY